MASRWVCLFFSIRVEMFKVVGTSGPLLAVHTLDGTTKGLHYTNGIIEFDSLGFFSKCIKGYLQNCCNHIAGENRGNESCHPASPYTRSKNVLVERHLAAEMLNSVLALCNIQYATMYAPSALLSIAAVPTLLLPWYLRRIPACSCCFCQAGREPPRLSCSHMS